MAKPKLTEWFDAEIAPVHVGVYQRDYGSSRAPRDLVFNYWDGSRWGSYGMTPDEAAEKGRRGYGVLNQAWRGLAEQPKEQKK